MKPKTKYNLRVFGSMIAYTAGLFALNFLYSKDSPYRYWLVLLPVLPVVYMAFAVIRYVGELDEMWRKIITEAAAFSGIATGFSCLSYLFLRDMGAPEFHGEWAFSMMWMYYGIGMIFSRWRYR